jgi:acetyl esterase/lipase
VKKEYFLKNQLAQNDVKSSKELITMKILWFVLVFATLSVAQTPNITIVFGSSYDSINSGVRTYGLWYESSHAINDPTMPIAVYIHGGAWARGSGFGKIGVDDAMVPGTCDGTMTNTVICSLAALGYAVYSINYTLTQQNDASTQWPVQWQDCECFLKFLAEQAGVSVPGNPNNIYLFGHSAGAHLVGVTALAPHNTFPTNCSHTSTAYKIKALVLASPPLNLEELYSANPTVDGPISALLGCSPGPNADASCLAIAASADPATYVGESQPPTMVETGEADQSIPYYLQGALQTAYSQLSPPVPSVWNVYPNFSHNLDLFYYAPCSSGPDGGEPSPCGAGGSVFNDLTNFFQQGSLPSFALGPASGSPTSATVRPGQSAGFNLEINPSGGFNGTITLACSIAPSVAQSVPICTVPSSVSVTGGTTAPVTVSVATTAAVTSSIVSPGSFPLGPMPLAWTATLLAASVLWRRKRRLPALAASLMVLAITVVVGCGGGSTTSQTTPGTPSGTYTATVTATSGTLRSQTSLTVVVQ